MANRAKKTEHCGAKRGRDAARAHFRRACELLAMTPFPPVDFKPLYHVAKKPADVWMVQIMVEVNAELAKQEKKP